MNSDPLSDTTSGANVTPPPAEIWFDYLPLSDSEILFRVVITRFGRKSCTDFRIRVDRLPPERATEFRESLKRYEAGDPRPLTPLERERKAKAMVYWIAALMDHALIQAGVLDIETRNDRVKEILLYGPPPSEPPSDVVMPQKLAPEKAPVDSEQEPAMGLSPFLHFVSPRAAQQLAREHNIDVEELRRESKQLGSDQPRFWEHVSLSPGSVTESLTFFRRAAQEYDKKLIGFHERVRHVGELLGGRVGRALMDESDYMINSLTTKWSNKRSR
jgi:hypothetical protein